MNILQDSDIVAAQVIRHPKVDGEQCVPQPKASGNHNVPQPHKATLEVAK
jgi:hypothetical protein